MGRVKTAPVRLKKTAANLDPPGPRAPRYQHTIWFVEDVSEYWPLGDVWVGRTANVLPPVWKKCGVNFRQLGDDAWSVHLHFDTEELVIVNLTNDVGFIKGKKFVVDSFLCIFINMIGGIMVTQSKV